MHFVRFAQFAIVAVTSLFIGSSAQAVAVMYGTYYDESVTPSCMSGGAACTVAFSQLPPNKLLLVTHVACFAQTTSPIVFATLGIFTAPTSGTLQRDYPLQLPQPVQAGSVYYTQISHPVNFLIGQSRYPHVAIAAAATTNAWAIKCTISGTLINPIP
ncbi:hypothetical protein JQ628_04960 [Bradyrhizobium lablabi]|uniref:hypothetical protein n=1 Tax=Bradyrhizobium lablabi TaxID=722472 RepID=UPI001BAAEEBA|nr:hypothetical protein [Bradyrhizobium lablabi]MBR1120858.1 hypothetical protein [Bradyrhizobium lablabi]